MESGKLKVEKHKKLSWHVPSPDGLCQAQTSGGRLCERLFLTRTCSSFRKGLGWGDYRLRRDRYPALLTISLIRLIFYSFKYPSPEFLNSPNGSLAMQKGSHNSTSFRWFALSRNSSLSLKGRGL